jgi:carbon starvation protein CstA
MGKARYVWCTLIPLAFMCVNTLTAGWLNLSVNYLRPQLAAGASSLWAAFLAAPMPAKIQTMVTLLLMVLLVVVVVDSLVQWGRPARAQRAEGRETGEALAAS